MVISRSESAGRSRGAKTPQEKRTRSRIKKRKYFRREKLVYVLFGFAFIFIVVWLAYLQLFNASEIRAMGSRFALTESPVSTPFRGRIVDAQGQLLVSSVEERQIFVDPVFIKSFIGSSRNTKGWTADSVAETLSEMLSLDKGHLTEVLRRDVQYERIASNVDLELAQAIMDLGIDGVGSHKTYRRCYPLQTYAAGSLGIVLLDGNGAEGVERSYNNELLGKGFSGPQSLKLTLDSTIQHWIEKEVIRLVREYSPDRVCVLAMDPKSGKILGNASYPSFDPNDYQKKSMEDRKNLAVTMTYEPGSVFKIITGSAAVEEAVITQNELFNDPGFLNVGRRTITNWDANTIQHGLVTFSDGMISSSNVVLAQVGQRLGRDKFFSYLRSFGFGEKSGVDLPAEEMGLLVDERETREIELAVMSFGQSNLVTPVQMLSAICAVANGGTLYRPYIVDTIYDSQENVVRQNQPKIVREILSLETCSIMNDILIDVVEEGTGGRAKISGIRVAGKTGTAQKLNPDTLEYYDNVHIVSFGAYAPADDPKIALLIVVDNPHGQEVLGGQVAAPAAKNILEGVLHYMGVPVEKDTPDDIDSFKSTEGPSSTEVNPERPLISGEACVPNLRGMTMGQAGQALSAQGLTFSFEGSGLVIGQSPKAGSIVNVGDQVKVTFESHD
ncbi:MAG: penicillin-binding transpeptidase domain-containing protein [Peptococcaceae bacterium]|nr:penicillin-binding transpeptidase domain-containing protein [Peptococcaceae bacterium]